MDPLTDESEEILGNETKRRMFFGKNNRGEGGGTVVVFPAYIWEGRFGKCFKGEIGKKS